MKTRLLQGFTLVMLVVMFALVNAVASANVQSANKVVADIPFAFNVGYKTMPAGKYEFQILTSAGDALLIQSNDRISSAVRLSEGTDRAKTKPQARLLFHRYGQQFFLAEVWNGKDVIGRRLMRSQEERALQLELAGIAANDATATTSYETIEVLASLQ